MFVHKKGVHMSIDSTTLDKWDVDFDQKLDWNSLSSLRLDLEQKIYELLIRGGEKGESLAYKLCWIGSPPTLRPLVEREIIQLIQESSGLVSFSKIEETSSWEATYSLSSKTSDSLQKFKECYKSQILTGAALVSSAWAFAAAVAYASGKTAKESGLSAQIAARNLIPTIPKLDSSDVGSVHLASVITCPISLSDLLSQNFQNLLNPPIPFNLPVEIPNLPTTLPPNFPTDIAVNLSVCPPPQIPVLEIPVVNVSPIPLPTPAIASIPVNAPVEAPAFPMQSWFADFLQTAGGGVLDKPNFGENSTSSQNTDWLPNFLETVGNGVINTDLLSSELRQPLLLASGGVLNTTNWSLKFLETIGNETLRIDWQEPDPSASSIKEHWVGKFLEVVGKEMLYVNMQEPISKPICELSIHFKTSGEKLNHCRIGGINGINTNYETMTSHAKYLNQFIPDQSLDWVYNRTHGALTDLGEVFSLNYEGVSLNTSTLLFENWAQFLLENIGNPNAKYLQFCHSQGAIHTKNALESAPKEIRDRIIVVAIAPANVVPQELCFAAFNYASKKDIVHYGELFYAALSDTIRFNLSNAMKSALANRAQLILLDPHPGATGIDHDWQSPTFAKKIRDHILEYMGNKGEYK